MVHAIKLVMLTSIKKIDISYHIPQTHEPSHLLWIPNKVIETILYGIIISAITEYLYLKLEIISANIQFIQILPITSSLFFSVAFQPTLELKRDKNHSLVMNERQ